MKQPSEKSPSFLTDEECELSRRSFLRFMGAGAMLAGLTLPACRRAERYLVPYNQGPEWNVPGLPTHYATCMPRQANPVPMIAVCRDGRPVKLEPSPRFSPATGLDALSQASILGLYDPSRSRRILFQGQPTNEHEWEGAFRSWAKKTVSGGKTAFIVGEDDSPVRTKLLEDIRRRNPNARFFSWEPVSRSSVQEAFSSALKPGARQSVDWSKVQRVLSIDCDFLGSDPLGNSREFMSLRLPEGNDYGVNPTIGPKYSLNRLYAAEGRLSITGGIADHRLPLHPSDVGSFLLEIARRVAEKTKSPALPPFPPPAAALSPEIRNWADICTKDLCEHPGQSLVVLGSSYPQEFHRLVLSINTALKAPGVCLRFFEGNPPITQPLSQLPGCVKRGEVEILFVLCSSNPAIDTPGALGIEKILNSPDIESIHLGMYVNETAKACKWHIPASHYLETWGIERNNDGMFLYRQPVMSPLYDSYGELEILSGLLNTKGVLFSRISSAPVLSPAYHQVRKCFEQAVAPQNREAGWDDALRLGYSQESSFPVINSLPEPPNDACMKTIARLAEKQRTKGDISIQLVPDYSSQDGRFAANAWLQECPDPITGLSWDAPAQCSPSTAAALSEKNMTDNPILEITLEGKEPLQFVLCPTPGMPDELLVLPLGYGTDNPLFTEGEELNANSYAFGKGGSAIPFHIEKKNIRILSKHSHTPARNAPVEGEETPWTGEHAAPQKISDIVRKASSSDCSNQWGMTIDLNLCTGCNACVVACQAENNIPVVGREQIIRGRLMQWIRIDRYLVTSARGTSLLPHPVACQQCGKAPCESVCPVNATVHTADGLNAMTYARCWGTRYCAANCPFKARRFNFFDYAKSSEKTTMLHPNPTVTVRSRGVMEKCTYCVQRIEQAKIRHKAALMEKASNSPLGPELTDEDLGLPDGAVKTACQIACPANAIRFGNMLHSKSVVTAAKASPRTFSFLSETGTLPRTSYLKRVGNPNPEFIS